MNNKPVMVVEILRSFVVERLVCGGRPGKFLEIGCGLGSFSIELGKKGFFGKGIDLSEEAVEWCRDLAKHEMVDRVAFEHVNFFDLQEEENYDYVFCFEVLEHIENDVEGLKKIYGLVKKGGWVIFSVPAHMKKWMIMDELAGHLRRYEKEELFNKLNKVGFSEFKVLSYGIPFLNIWHFLKYKFLPTKNMYLKVFSEYVKGMDAKERTEVSGALTIKTKHNLHGSLLIKIAFNKFTLYPFCLLQLAFLEEEQEIGNAFLVIAKK